MPSSPSNASRQFQQLLSARETGGQDLNESAPDVNSISKQSWGSYGQATAWRTSHVGAGAKPPPIRADNFGSWMFKESQEFEPVKGHTGKPKQ